MKVASYQAHNVLRVEDINWQLEGRHLFLVGGKNGEGKTSALKALLLALCGRSGMDWPEVTLREGENEGWVRVALVPEGTDAEEIQEFQKLNVELYLKRKRNGQVAEEFRVTDSAGEEAPEPRTLLKRLYHLKAFDPLAFEKLDRKAKRELLTKLVGLDFASLKADYQRLYREREGINREGKAVRARFDNMKRHDDAPAQEVSVQTLMAELDARRQGNLQNEKERERHRLLKRELEIAENRKAELEKEVARLMASIDGLKMDVDKSAREIEQHALLVDRLHDANEEEIRTQISNADTVNRKVRENAIYDETATRLESLREESATLTVQMEDIDEQQHKALQAAHWPVPGLSVDDEGVLLDGLPYEQASKSQRVRASVRIGMALNPSLRLLVCEDGNDLDADTLQELQGLLAENDYQMLLEFVTRGAEDEARCAVIVRDGKSATGD